jgi:hypothetical protein
MPLWRDKVDEWRQLLENNLSMPVAAQEDTLRDPYLALKLAETKALSIAETLAPKRTRKPNEVRSSFCFAGNRTLFRELNLLRKARSLVEQVITSSLSAVILTHPHRLTRWTVAVSSGVQPPPPYSTKHAHVPSTIVTSTSILLPSSRTSTAAGMVITC